MHEVSLPIVVTTRQRNSYETCVRWRHEPRVAASERHKKGRGRAGPPPFLFRDVCFCYLMILRATRPPATNRAPAPSANSDAAPLPPVFGSSFGGGGGGGGAGGGGGGGAFGEGASEDRW